MWSCTSLFSRACCLLPISSPLCVSVFAHSLTTTPAIVHNLGLLFNPGPLCGRGLHCPLLLRGLIFRRLSPLLKDMSLVKGRAWGPCRCTVLGSTASPGTPTSSCSSQAATGGPLVSAGGSFFPCETRDLNLMFLKVPSPSSTPPLMAFIIGDNNGNHCWVRFFTDLIY